MTDLDALKATLIQKQIEYRAAVEAYVAVEGSPFTPWAPHLGDAQLINCRVLPSRYSILDYMPKEAVCAEIGSQAGNFAMEIIKRTRPKKFHIVDLFLDQFQYRAALEEMEKQGILQFHEGYSSSILESFEDHYFDWIYIDGDHSYEGFVADLDAASRKLKANGFIVCNDYTVWSPGEVSPYGILQGVHEFCVEKNWEFAFIGLHGQGYHDVCLRKRIGDLVERS